MSPAFRTLLLSVSLASTTAGLGGADARAQERPAATAPPKAEAEPGAAESELPPGFRPIRGKEESAQVDPNPLVVMAYGAILGGLFVYVLWMVRRQGQLSRDIAELAKELERRQS